MKIVIPFAQIKANNPNLGSKSSSSPIETYFQCIVVAFASLRRWNPKLSLQLTTNLPIEERYTKLLRGFRVEIKLVDFTYNPPKEFGNTFRGCFFLFDAIAAEEDDVLFIDPDIYCIGEIPLDIFLNQQFGALLLCFPDDKNINGLTPFQARKILAEIGSYPPIVDHKHYGGEAIYVPKRLREKFIQDVDGIWKKNVAAATSGKPFLTTEEHIISLILSKHEVVNLDSVILRIWTTIKYGRVEGGILASAGKSLWHLPAEKSYGFKTAYDLLLEDKLYQDISKSKQLSFEQRIFHIKNRFQRLFTKSRYWYSKIMFDIYGF
jgi:hypothetical protein